MLVPKNIQIINRTLALLWSDGTENYFDAYFLRKHSPSAQNIGEKDILGNHYQGAGSQNINEDIGIIDFQFIGNYALKIQFSDGHNTGLFSWDYLKKLSELN